jgi:hypothetical protein
MILLIRFILVSLIIYLIIRSFARFFDDQRSAPPRDDHDHYTDSGSKDRGVSKEVGEYVDYEEVDD